MSSALKQIVPYEPRWRAVWDEFVRRSRNGHFMLERGYMDYHADRFQDSSLLFFHEGRLAALLPAHRCNGELVSHEGLPFGGFVVGPSTVHRDLVSVFAALPAHLRDLGVGRLTYTPAPLCYHASPVEDDLYLLHRAGARCTSIKLSAGFSGPVPQHMSGQTRRAMRKAERKLPCEFFECHEVAVFWGHLERFLEERRAARPVHTAGEMTLLKGRFPEHIRMFFARAGGEIVGGELVYLTSRVQRGQYSFRHRNDSTSVSRRLSLWLAVHPDYTRPWIDLGTSVDPGTSEIDAPLFFSKENTGARGTVVQTWTWDFA